MPPLSRTPLLSPPVDCFSALSSVLPQLPCWHNYREQSLSLNRISCSWICGWRKAFAGSRPAAEATERPNSFSQGSATRLRLALSGATWAVGLGRRCGSFLPPFVPLRPWMPRIGPLHVRSRLAHCLPLSTEALRPLEVVTPEANRAVTACTLTAAKCIMMWVALCRGHYHWTTPYRSWSTAYCNFTAAPLHKVLPLDPKPAVATREVPLSSHGPWAFSEGD